MQDDEHQPSGGDLMFYIMLSEIEAPSHLISHQRQWQGGLCSDF